MDIDVIRVYWVVDKNGVIHRLNFDEGDAEEQIRLRAEIFPRFIYFLATYILVEDFDDVRNTQPVLFDFEGA